MAKLQILIVDDEERMRGLVRLYLQSDFSVIEASNGQEALSLVAARAPALVILDVMMPGMDGWTTLEQIRSEAAVPVIMLTACGGASDRVRGLRLGADDYVGKPFDGRELTARVHAVLRRSNKHSASVDSICTGSLVLDLRAHAAIWEGKALSLTPKEYELLHLLATHPGQILPRELLKDRVWGPDQEGGLRAVDSHIKNLRDKLGPGSRMIMTVWGLGYKFVEDERAIQ